MTTLNVLANAYEIPQLLGDEGKHEAVALKFLTRLGAGDDLKTRDVARSIVVRLAELGDEHKLDGVLGGYAVSSDAAVADITKGLPTDPDDIGRNRRLATALLATLVDHLRANPNDVGRIAT